MGGIQLFADGSGGVCLLEVESPPFSASTPFYFDEHFWKRFLAELAALDSTLSGEAKLGQHFEEPYICLSSVGGRGHILVKGVLVENSEHSQRLEFSFVTDQSVLTPFLTGLQAAAEAHAT
jgi:hypothetical protein